MPNGCSKLLPLGLRANSQCARGAITNAGPSYADGGLDKEGGISENAVYADGEVSGHHESGGERLGMAVVSAPEDQLLVFNGEARDGYREHMQHTRNP
jgi:hypothetical protein